MKPINSAQAVPRHTRTAPTRRLAHKNGTWVGSFSALFGILCFLFCVRVDARGTNTPLPSLPRLTTSR